MIFINFCELSIFDDIFRWGPGWGRSQQTKFQIRVGLNRLNFHKFKHNFRDTVNPMCRTNDGIEDTEHFLLLCPSFDVQRRHLLAGVSVLLQQFVEINSLPNDVLVQILLYGDENLSNEINKSILELTLVFIHNTGRFD